MPIVVLFEEQICAAVCRAYTGDCSMNVLKSGKIVHNPDLCTACGVCELMCSLYHDGIIGPLTARANILRDAFTAQHRHTVCQQCDENKHESAVYSLSHGLNDRIDPDPLWHGPHILAGLEA